ncbi:MAG: tetratricopeptide repeat protein [Terriglobales bacterium]
MWLRRFLWLALGFVLSAASLRAQGPDIRTQTQVWLRVLVTYENGRPAHRQLRVQLLTSTEGSLGENNTNDEGWVEFSNVPPGSYHLRISGFGVEDTTTNSFSILEGTRMHLETVEVKTSEKETPAAASLAPVVAASDLDIPGNASKEYAKGAKALREGKWAEARSRLEKAIALYPRYAMAYNDLGVAWMNEEEREKGRAAFEKAIELNPGYARAYRHLAMLLIQANRYEEAGRLLEKSLGLEPLDPQGLSLLAHVQFLTGRMEEAAATARKVHSVPHQGFAVAHLISAQALESRHLVDEAAAEYRLFLQEAPNSASADKARAALDKLAAKVN